MSSNDGKVVVLDTNAFYDLCFAEGLNDFGLPVGHNIRVDYNIFKIEMEKHLKSQSLFVPSTTVFEFVCKFRNQEENLKKLIVFLKEISKKYNYNILGYNEYDNYGDLFEFDEFTEECWKRIDVDYSSLLELRNMIEKAKIGSEAELITIFARLIIHCYITDFLLLDEAFSREVSHINRFLLYNPFGDVKHYIVKKSIAWELYGYYCNSKEGKNKKTIFESAMKRSSYLIKMYFELNKNNQDRFSDSALNIDLESEKSIQSGIFNWYKRIKDVQKLKKSVSEITKYLSETTDLNVCQIKYIENLLMNMFTHGTKREKNDAEDFWNLGFVRDGVYLVSFELEIINTMREASVENYEYLKKFYTC